MNSEDEEIKEELLQIRLHQNIMKDLLFCQYVLTPEFKDQFEKIPKKVCKQCGESFRVTHWCENQNQQIWIPNWEKILRADFKPDRPNPLEIPIKGLEDIQNMETEELLPKSEIPINSKTQTTIPIQKREIQPKVPPKSKPYKIPASNETLENKKLYIPPRNTNVNQEKKLSISSITRLSQKERIVYHELINWRNIQANREKIRPFMIAVDTTIMAIVYYRVSSTNELLQISGITPQIAQKYGSEILRIMYRNGIATGIKTHQQQKKPINPQKSGSGMEPEIKKIIAGFACCFAIIIIGIIIAAL
jgi:hypothetical protein